MAKKSDAESTAETQRRRVAKTDNSLGPSDGDEAWWQVKFVGLDGDDQPMTPFGNVISSPNAPAG
jgi:hypothetical protein